jgi:DNA polymerase IV
MRKIIHIDMDAFFASVEQRDFPEYAGKPIAVGGSSLRGVVAAASYEARKYGVRSAMPVARALRLCPDLILVKSRFEVYREVSTQIRDIFYRYTDLVEPLSLDEAYLDVTEPKIGPPSALLLARRIKQEIKTETGLTASAGVSFNKFLAKTASDLQKPDGLTLIPPEKAEAFIAGLPIEQFYGVGDATAAKMHALGIRTGADLRIWSEEDLRAHFGKTGSFFYNMVRAQDDRPVRPNRERKSVGAEQTFMADIQEEAELMQRLSGIIDRLTERLARSSASGRTVTLKIKYHDFEITTRSRTLDTGVSHADQLRVIASDLLRTPFLPERPVRLLGLTLSNLTTDVPLPADQQLTFSF